MTIRHIFLWSVEGESNGRTVLAELARLPELVGELTNWAIGEHVGADFGGRAFQYGLTVDFTDRNALREYEKHPEHQSIVDRAMPYYSDWTVVDLELPND